MLRLLLNKTAKIISFVIKQKYIFVAVFIGLLAITGTFSYVLSKTSTPKTVKSLPNSKITPSITLSITPSNTVSYSSKIDTTPIPSQTQPITAVTPVSTRTKDITAPVITQITGPENGQTITSNNFCFPMVISDNSSKYPNIFVHIKFDSDSWGNWSTNVAPCFNNVSNGSHSFSAQAKDESGNESGIITKIFTVQFPQEITVSVTGVVYRDENCNGNKDGNEMGISGTTVNVFKNPEFSLLSTPVTDSNGSYSYSKNINENDYLDLQLVPVSPSGYKSNPKQGAYTIRLKSDYRSANYLLPQVPNENVGLCQ